MTDKMFLALGITPAPWTEGVVGQEIGNKKLIAVAPEMLDHLIHLQSLADFSGKESSWEIKHLIEKATGKTWEEVNEILDTVADEE